jgi:hypothetical protein
MNQGNVGQQDVQLYVKHCGGSDLDWQYAGMFMKVEALSELDGI